MARRKATSRSASSSKEGTEPQASSQAARTVTTVDASLIAPAFWFRLRLGCLRREGIPKSVRSGRILDLDGSHRLLDAADLEGRPAWAEVRAAWNDRGLAFAASVRGKQQTPTFDPALPEGSDGLLLWIDTRNARDMHRATRHCHQFAFGLIAGERGKTLQVDVRQRKIARALVDAPIAEGIDYPTWARRTEDGWELEVFLPREALHGFDPELNRLFGLAAVVIDPHRSDPEHALGVGREFPVRTDPSLWAVLELVDDDGPDSSS